MKLKEIESNNATLPSIEENIVSLLREDRTGELFHQVASYLIDTDDPAFGQLIRVCSGFYKSPRHAYLFTLGAEINWTSHHLEAEKKSQSLPPIPPPLVNELHRRFLSGEVQKLYKEFANLGLLPKKEALLFLAKQAIGLTLWPPKEVTAICDGFDYCQSLMDLVKLGSSNNSFAFSGRP